MSTHWGRLKRVQAALTSLSALPHHPPPPSNRHRSPPRQHKSLQTRGAFREYQPVGMTADGPPLIWLAVKRGSRQGGMDGSPGCPSPSGQQRVFVTAESYDAKSSPSGATLRALNGFRDGHIEKQWFAGRRRHYYSTLWLCSISHRRAFLMSPKGVRATSRDINGT